MFGTKNFNVKENNEGFSGEKINTNESHFNRSIEAAEGSELFNKGKYEESLPENPSELGDRQAKTVTKATVDFSAIEGFKAFVQMLYPEEIKETGLESFSAQTAVEIYEELLDGFKKEMEKNAEEKEIGKNADNITNSMDKCRDALGKIESCLKPGGKISNLDKTYDARFDLAKKVFKHFETLEDSKGENPDNTALQGINAKELEQLGVPIRRYLKEKSKHYIPDSIKAAMVAPFCEGSKEILENIVNELNQAGVAYLPGGWRSERSGHATCVILEKTGGKIYAHEINSGGGLDRQNLARESDSIYAEEGTPGSTIEIQEQDLSAFIACTLELNSEHMSKEYNAIGERGYLAHWKGYYLHNEVIVVKDKNEIDKIRPNFEERFQRSGNCALKSTEILVHTILQREIAKSLKKDINDEEVVSLANQWYHTFTIYSQLHMLKSCLAWHKNNTGKITRDSLDLMSRGIGRLGYYIDRHSKELKVEDNGKIKSLLEESRELIDKVEIYLISENAARVKYAANEHSGLPEKIQPVFNYTNGWPKMAERENFSVPSYIFKGTEDSKTSQWSKIADLASTIANELQKKDQGIANDMAHRRDLLHNATELFRRIPLPGSEEWDKFIAECDSESLAKSINVIVQSFWEIPVIKSSIGKMKHDEEAIKSQLSDRGNFQLPWNEVGAVANATAKARIVSFELLKSVLLKDNNSTPSFSSVLNLENMQVDNRWFTSYCKSGYNRPMRLEDAEEQKSLLKFIANHEPDDPIFDSSGTRLLDGDGPSSTLKICDELAKKIDENLIKDLIKEAKKKENKTNFQETIKEHPGLFLFDDLNVYLTLGFSTKIQNLSNVFAKDPKKYSGEFALIMNSVSSILRSGPIEVRLLPSGGGYKGLSAGKVRPFENALSKLGGGYRGLSENQTQVGDDQTDKFVNRIMGNDASVADAIIRAMSNPPTQTMELLVLLRNNGEIGDNFSSDGESFLSKMWFNAFSKPVIGADKNKDKNAPLDEDSDDDDGNLPAPDSYVRSVDGIEFPLQKDAGECPTVLCNAMEDLYTHVKDVAIGNAFGHPKVNRLCSAVHAIYVANTAIIDNAKEERILNTVANLSTTMLEDIKSALENKTLTPKEILLLKFAESECIATLVTVAQKRHSIKPSTGTSASTQLTPVDAGLMAKLYANVMELQGTDICGNLPAGCAHIIYGFIPTLAGYWETTSSDYREKVALEIWKTIIHIDSWYGVRFEHISPGVVFLKGQLNELMAGVDLMSTHIYFNGKNIEPSGSVFSNDVFKRLFPPSNDDVHAIRKEGEDNYFHDDKYGDIRIPSEGFRIYRKDSTNMYGQEMLYVPPEDCGYFSLPECFAGDDFTIWMYGNGQFEICAKDDPNKILYMTTQGQLFDRERWATKTPPYFISFLGEAGETIDEEEISAIGNNLLSRFENSGNILYYYGDDGIAEAVLPRYVDKGGKPLSFTKRGKDFVLKSDPKYKLINAPWKSAATPTHSSSSSMSNSSSSSSTVNEENFLMGYDNAIWLENTNTKDREAFKCLLSDLKIKRSTGLTHDVYSEPHDNSSDRNLFGQAAYGEVDIYRDRDSVDLYEFDTDDLETDNLDVDKKASEAELPQPANVKMHPVDTLSGLRLAHIFQAQGEYEKALTFLDNLPLKDTLSKDEIDAFQNITMWFGADRGHEKNGLAAAVVLKAICKMLQISPFGERSKWLIAELLKANKNSSILQDALKWYLNSFDIIPWTMQMSFTEEKTLLENILMFSGKDFVVKNILEKRIQDLAELQGTSTFSSNYERKQAQLRVNVLRRENIPLGVAEGLRAKLDGGAGPSTDPSVNISPTYSQPKPDKLEDLLNKIDNKILLPTSVSSTTSELSEVARDNSDLGKVKLSDAEEKQFKNSFTKSIEWVRKELKSGEGQLILEKSNDDINVPSTEDAGELVKAVGIRRKNAIKSAKNAISRIVGTMNAGRIEKKFGSDAWGRWTFRHVLRAYGISLSNRKDSRQQAVTHLLKNYPWVDENNADELFKNVESYLTSINSLRNCRNILTELNVVSDTKSGEDARKAAWRSAIPLFRQDHSNTLNGDMPSELRGNLLMFTYMSGVFPRIDQIEKMRAIASEIKGSGEKVGALIQQIMGSGKTKVLLPFLISLLMNRGDNLPMIVSHISQMPMVVPELRAILSTVGIRLGVISLNYQQFSDPDVIHGLRNSLEVSFKNRDPIYAISSNTLLAMRTAFRTLWSADTNDSRNRILFQEFTGLFELLENNGIALMDEVHLTLNPKEAFITVPPQTQNGANARVPESEVNFITNFIYNLPKTLIDDIKNNVQDQKSKDILANIFTYHVEQNCKQWFDVPEEMKSNFAKFVCGKFDAGEDANENSSSPATTELPTDLKEFLDKLPDEKQAHLCLLRKLCSSTLPQCLSRTYGEHYGYNERGQIVVYRNHQPTESYFQDPYLTLASYVAATIHHGIPDVSLSKWVDDLARQAKSDVDSGFSLENTGASKQFAKFFNTYITLDKVVNFSGSSSIPVAIPEKIKEMKEYLAKNPENGRELAAEFANQHSSYADKSYTTTPIDIANIFHDKISMTGTTSNSTSYVDSVKTLVSPQDGALGKVASKLMSDATDGKTHVIGIGDSNSSDGKNENTVGNMLSEWIGKINGSSSSSSSSSNGNISDLRIIVDYGAQFKDQPVRESVRDIANFIDKNGIGATHIEYFDPQMNEFAIAAVSDIITNKDNFVARKISNTAVDRPADRSNVFTFLDSPRSTGTDPYLMPNAHGITTIDLFQNDFDGMLQAIMRERKFTNVHGQTMDLVIRQKSIDSVKSTSRSTSTSSNTSGNTMSVNEVMDYMILNTASKNLRQQIQSVMLQIQELPRRFIEMKLRKILMLNGEYTLYSSWNTAEEFIKATQDIMLSQENFNPDMWKNVRTWNDVKSIATNMWADKRKKLQKISGVKNEDLEAMDAEIKKSIEALPADAKILGFADDIPLDGKEITQQQERQQDQQQDQERQQELEQIRNVFDSSNDKSAQVAQKIVAPESSTSAFKFTETWTGSTPLGQYVREENFPAAGVSGMYVSAKNAIPQIFDDQFFATHNFLNVTTAGNSVFRNQQKNAEFLLISWDNSTPRKTKCHFLSRYDFNEVSEMIKNSKLTNCHLCSIEGTDMIENGDAPNVGLDSDVAEFRKQAIWMGKFFNGDISWINANKDLTDEMLGKFYARTAQKTRPASPLASPLNNSNFSPSISPVATPMVAQSPIPSNNPLDEKQPMVSGNQQLTHIMNFLILRSNDYTSAYNACKSAQFFQPLFNASIS
ncbi:MAG: hypothetical protein LBI81_01395 [Puniceicoccales bacterium]|nr:hypothetical protein [Puniceicoccales bacterium]